MLSHIKDLCCDRMRRQPVTAINGHQYDYDFGFLWIAGSTILVRPQIQNIAGGKHIRIRKKSVSRQNFPHSKVFGFKVDYFASLDYHCLREVRGSTKMERLQDYHHKWPPKKDCDMYVALCPHPSNCKLL